MTDRALEVLRILREETDEAQEPGPENDWQMPVRALYAFRVEDALQAAGLSSTTGHAAIGAANTLAALRRQGLTAKGGDGVFIQARWWITPAGSEALAEATG